jgi:signal transduction histidine kinase
LTYLTALVADKPDEVQQFARLAEEQTAIIADVANTTLGFAKAASRPKPTDLVLLAQAALRIHQQAIDAKQVRLVKDLASDVIGHVYTGEMLQVLSNLLTNALDALPPDGAIGLRLRKSKGQAHLLVADNGRGIPPEHLEQVFEPFFTTKDERGNGLGLAISKKIIERHRGTIKMRSNTRPGKNGTLFRISLPLSAG